MNLDALIEGVADSRAYFLKHIEGLPDQAWTFKPYPECKSVLETLVHLRIDDDMAVESILSQTEPDYAAATVGAYEQTDRGSDFLLARLATSHQALLDLLRTRFADSPLDAEICVWGAKMPLYRGIPYFSSEDFYHAGQVAYIRMAIQPDWNYYGEIYGH